MSALERIVGCGLMILCHYCNMSGYITGFANVLSGVVLVLSVLKSDLDG